jgi:hypothetical protein
MQYQNKLCLEESIPQIATAKTTATIKSNKLQEFYKSEQFNTKSLN